MASAVLNYAEKLERIPHATACAVCLVEANQSKSLQTDDAADAREEDKRLLSAEQLAARLKLSKRTLERMRNKGNGPRFTKVGNKVLYRGADVEAWLDERSFGSTAEAKRAQR